MSGSPPREELLHNAVLFLNDPQVQTSSLASKITFLEGKGLNEDEIQEALRRARSGHSGGASSAPVAGPSRGYTQTQAGYGYEQGFGQRMMPPEVPKRDWRDLFVCPALTSSLCSATVTDSADHDCHIRGSSIWHVRTGQGESSPTMVYPRSYSPRLSPAARRMTPYGLR